MGAGTKGGVHDGHRDRMRERILAGGLRGMQPHEVLEYLLYPFVPRKNTNDMAHALIDRFGSLSDVLNADADRLQEVAGVTANAALFLSTLPEVFRVYAVDAGQKREKLCGKGQGREFCRKMLYGQPVEMVYALATDSHENVIKSEKISSGSGDEVAVSVRDIADFAMRTKASGIILAHNHPSGHVSPSTADFNLTREIYWTLDGLSVKLQEHYIFAGNECYSFFEDGQLGLIKEEKDNTFKDGILFYARKSED